MRSLCRATISFPPKTIGEESSRLGKFAYTSRMFTAASLALLCLGEAAAGPLIIEEDTRLTSPDSSYALNGPVAAWANGVAPDVIVAAASKTIAGQGGALPVRVHAAFLFQREQGSETWRFVRKLVEQADAEGTGVPITVAADDHVLAVNLPTPSGSSLHVFEIEPIEGREWLPAPVVGSVATSHLAASDNVIIAGHGACSWDARLFGRDNTGRWIIAADITGPFRGCDERHLGGDVGIGGYLIVAHPSSVESPPQVRFFSRPSFPGDRVYPQATFSNPEGVGLRFGDVVTTRGIVSAVSGTPTGGIAIYDVIATGWRFLQSVRPVDVFTAGLPADMDFGGGLFARQHNQPDGAVAIYREEFRQPYSYVAKLVPGVGKLAKGSVALPDSGRFVVVQGEDAAYVYDLPQDFTQPLLRQDDFEDGNSFGWNPQVGSNFSVVNGPNSRAYRQQSVAGDAASLLGDSEMSNQSIQADVRPIAFSGADRWAGLAVRHRDAGNYYYVTMRSTNVVRLRKLVNGAIHTLASAPLTVTPGRSYNLRLEAIGTNLRVYVDGRQVLRARDTDHKQGSAGLVMYRTSADYDNVVVTPNLRTTLLADNFETGSASWWTTSGVGRWSIVSDGGSKVYAQSSVSELARSITGVPATEDQLIEARAKATSFGTGPGRWFGLIARYQNDNDYYYITVRNDNTVSLRKLSGGAIHVLDTAPLTVVSGTWYRLRLEALGTSLRAYVNDRLVLEAQDAQFPNGQYGVAMYKAATRFDDFKVVQP
jgi:hypothetical protein